MMDNAEQEILCLDCHKPVQQIPHHKRRLYCNDTCKMRYLRKKKAQEATEQEEASKATLQARIAQLEQECFLYASHIAELEDENRKLREQLAVEHRYLVDSEPRAFKSWLRKRAFPEGSFATRLLADARFEKPRYSKSWFEATLSTYGYSAEDIATFRNLWKAMLLEQS